VIPKAQGVEEVVTATDKKMNKTAFLKEFLKENPSANYEVVTEAWTKAGNTGTISTTLVSNIRNDLGLAGNLRTRSKPAEANGATESSKPKAKVGRPKKKTTKTKVSARARAKGDLNDRSETSLVPALKSKSLGKSSFVKEVLFDNPQANTKKVNDAWTKAGMEGRISDSLVSAIKSGLGLARGLKSEPETASGESVTRTTKPKKNNQATSKASGPSSARANRAESNGASAEPAPARKARMSDRERLLAEVEGDIDRLMFKLMRLGGLEAVEDALRSARRVVVRSHEG
jgi:hypothetical protein